jgi:hypothetical protein
VKREQRMKAGRRDIFSYFNSACSRKTRQFRIK